MSAREWVLIAGIAIFNMVWVIWISSIEAKIDRVLRTLERLGRSLEPRSLGCIAPGVLTNAPTGKVTWWDGERFRGVGDD